MAQKVLIIGGVAGGATTAARLRRNDETANIIVIERGEYISFANCGLPYYIGNVIANRDSLIVQSVEEMSAKYRLDIRIFHEVTKIDPVTKTIILKNLKTSDETTETYDKLVISSGSFPIKPGIPGLKEATNLFTLRTIPDTDAIKQYISQNHPTSAVVIGGGFIGLEMAENLHHLGLSVTIVEMANQVMAPIDFEMASIVHQHILDHNVTLLLNDGVKSFEQAGKRIVLSSGKVLETDLIIFAIGVKPESQIAKAAGLAIGERGGIQVNDYLQTSDPAIYAIGDAIEVTDVISGKPTMIPLAGPANKQGRIVADNLCGGKEIYRGTLGTAVVKVFDLTVGSTGNSEKALKAAGRPYQAIHIHPGSHAGYYPGSSTLSMKVLFQPITGEILGAQAVGMEGVDKRIDVIATAIAGKMKVMDLKNVELAYAPPYSSAKDPINMIGFLSENILTAKVTTVQWHEIDGIVAAGGYLLDVREPVEHELGAIAGSINIPLSQVRSRLAEIPRDKVIHVYCQSGIRAYSACRILSQNGYVAKNLDGGFKSYQCVFKPSNQIGCITKIDDAGVSFSAIRKEEPSMNLHPVTLSIDACGLQCPGPIVQVYKSLQSLQEGDILDISATDPGFLKDIKHWADKTGNTLLDLKTDGKIIRASIRKGKLDLSQNKDVAVASSKENTTIVVFSQDLDKAIAAFIIATGAASMGKKVSLFFTFWGLNILRKPKHVFVKKTFIERMFGFMMPRGTEKLPISNMNMMGIGPIMIKGIMKKKNVDSLRCLMQNAQSLGVKIIACAMSMDIMGIKKEELIDNIEIAGVATYLSDTTEANHNLFI